MNSVQIQWITFISVCWILLIPLKSSGQERIALVLSGGGAQGLAHIGLMQAFEELQVPIDVIYGTSAGALAGGLYAAGMTAEEMKLLSDDGVIYDLFLGRESPESVPIWQRNSRRPGNFSISRGQQQVLGPPGIVDDKLILQELFLWTLAADFYSRQNFDSLLIPFRAVAGDLYQKKAKLIDRGPLSEAMRISMSIPLIYAPVEKDASLYVDGGVFNNLPVDFALADSADFIIAVNVTDPLPEEQPKDIFQSFSILSATMFGATDSVSIKGWDHYINIDTGSASMFDFGAGRKLIDEGYRRGLIEGRKILEKIQTQRSDNLNIRRQNIRRANQDLNIRTVIISDRQSSEFLRSEHFADGDFPQSISKIRDYLNALKTTGKYRQISPSLSLNGDTLHVKIRKKPSLSMMPSFQITSMNGFSFDGLWEYRPDGSRYYSAFLSLGNEESSISLKSMPYFQWKPKSKKRDKGFADLSLHSRYRRWNLHSPNDDINYSALRLQTDYHRILSWDQELRLSAYVAGDRWQNIQLAIPEYKQHENHSAVKIQTTHDIYNSGLFSNSQNGQNPGKSAQTTLVLSATALSMQGQFIKSVFLSLKHSELLKNSSFSTSIIIRHSPDERPPLSLLYGITLPRAYEGQYELQYFGETQIAYDIEAQRRVLRDDLRLHIRFSKQHSLNNYIDKTDIVVGGQDIFLSYNSLLGPLEIGWSFLQENGFFRSSSWTRLNIYI